MKSNILNLRLLREKYYDIHFKDNNLSIRDNASNLIPKVPMSKTRMFMLNIRNEVTKCLNATRKLLGFGIFDLGISILEN